MKKDKKWFVDKWTKERNKTDVHDPMYHFINEFIADVNQLDEPEVLSQGWLDEHVDYADVRGGTQAFIHVDDLQNLLVPKQELPVIPQFVADWIETRKENEWGDLFSAMVALSNIPLSGHLESGLARWFRKVGIEEFGLESEEVLAKLWLDGYEVEEEQKYYVDLETAAYIAKWDGDDSVQIYTDSVSGNDEYELHLTEQEIKDYDERFWAFAIPAEEADK